MTQVPPPPWGDKDWKAQQASTVAAAGLPPLKRVGPFVKGISGNPAGRPKGIRDKRTILQQAMEAQAPEIVKVVCEKALAGDMQAANMVLTRITPPARHPPTLVKFTLDTTRPAADMSAQVIAALAAGDLDVNSAQIVMQCIASHMQVLQADEFKRRLETLEKSMGSGTSFGAGMVIGTLDSKGNLVQ